MQFEKFGKTFLHRNPRNKYIPHSEQYKYAEQHKECKQEAKKSQQEVGGDNSSIWFPIRYNG